MSVINTNYLALVSQNNLSKSQGALGTAIERLSSGLRINSAKDDAAGQAIANRFTANIKGLTQAARNANDGISIAQTTEGALNEINNNLQRIRELTVQAQNGSNSASDIDSIQKEVNQRLEEINRVAEQTNFNGIQVLKGKDEDLSLNIQVGAQDNEVIEIKIAQNSTWNFFDTSGTVPVGDVNGEARTEAALGFDVLATTTVVDADRAEAKTSTAALTAGKSAAETASGLTTTAPTAGTVTTDIKSVTTDGVTQYYATVKHTETASPNTETDKVYSVTFDETGAVSLGNEVTDATEITAAFAGTTVADGDDVYTGAAGTSSNALATLDAALKAVDNQRSDLGAIQNRFQSGSIRLFVGEAV